MFHFHLILFPLLFFFLSGTIFWVWALIDCLNNEPNNDNSNNNKILWVLVLTLTHWIGALIYVFVRRPQRLKEIGR